MTRRALLGCALLACALGGEARADSGADRFSAANAMRARGDDGHAAAALVALADDLPADPLADDALFSAAQLYEEKLGDPARAAELYRRLLRDYPDSRVSLGAERRLAHLRAAMGPGDAGAAALAEMNDILFGHAGRPEAESIARMEALVARNPKWPGAVEAWSWLGDAYARAGRTSDALAALDRVITGWPASDEAFQALGRAAQLAARAGRFDAADGYVAAMYLRLRPGQAGAPLSAGGQQGQVDPARVHSWEDARALVARERLRARLYLASQLVFALLFLGLLASIGLGAGSPRAALRALVRPPIEVIYMLPVAGVLCASSLTGFNEIAPAVAIIAGAGVVIAWLNGVAIRLHRKRRLLVAAHALAAVIGVIAACYIAVHRNRLLDMIVSTVRFGPDV